MYPWEGVTSQMLGMGLGQVYQQQVYGSGLTFSTPPITFANCTITTGVNEEERVVEEPTEFKQLSNHKFHELLDKFKEAT